MSTVAANELKEKFGFESVFDTTSSSGKFYDKNLNFTKLLEKFKRLKYTSFHYRLGDFISGTTSVNEYTDSRGDKFYGKSYGNTKNGLVAIRRLKVDVDIQLNKLLKYIIKIPYAYPDSDEFDDRYAIIIDFEDYSSLELALNALTYPDKELVDIEIQDYFDEFFETDKSIDELKWIYKYAPDFVLKKRGDSDLIEDIKRFVSYDIDGFIGDWFRDASSPVIRALSSFTNLKNAYDHFNENPEDAIRTYSGLDDSGRKHFTELLSMLAKLYNKDYNKATFHIGKGYKLDSNLGQDSGVNFYLKETKLDLNNQPESPAGFGLFEALSVDLEIKSDAFYHPLDLVTLEDVKSGEQQVVVALDVKRLSDLAEWSDVVEIVFTTITIIAVLASAGVLASGIGGVAAIIAGLELVVGIGDLIQQVGLKGSEEGNWLERNWDSISGIVGVVSISSALRTGILKHGPKILSKLRNLRSANAIKLKKVIASAMLIVRFEIRIADLGTYTFRIVENVRFIKETNLQRLWRLGIFIGKADGVIAKGKKLYAIIYRGESVVEGSLKNIESFLKKNRLLKNGIWDAKAFEQLEKLVIRIRKIRLLGITTEKGSWFWKNARGSELMWPNLKKEVMLKNIKNKIKTTKNSTNPLHRGFNFEARAAERVFSLARRYGDEFTDYSNNIDKKSIRGRFEERIGDIDIATEKYIFEVKSSLNSQRPLKEIKVQIDKYLPENANISDKYLNPFNKQVVIVHKKGRISRLSKTVIELEEKGVIFVDGIADLNKLYK